MIINFRTIISFGEKNINYLLLKFKILLSAPHRDDIISGHTSGLFFGYSIFARYAYVSFVFYISALFIANKGDNPVNTFIGVYVLFISALGCGTQLAHAPSTGKAKDAANKVFAIINEQSTIDVREEKGFSKIEKGEIKLEDVDFRYPSKKSRVLRNLSMVIPATKKIALVGHSGCGKSTITNLLLRFYDISGGSIKIDDIDIRDYNTGDLRRQIGFVM
jgi:ABC-type multidrug transport system fused ATPase/permease subunit